MRSTIFFTCMALMVLSAANNVVSFGNDLTKRHISLHSNFDLQKRQPTGDFNQLYSASNYQNGSTFPGTLSTDNPGQTIIVGGTGADDDSQRPGCSTIFINTANVNGSQDNGWQEIPNVVGFYIDRNLTYDQTSTMPVFIESNKDFSKIKRILITQPGKPRDSWKYANLFRNSLNCAIANTSMSVEFEDVLITAPIWLTERDHEAGSGTANDIYFGNTGWDKGNKAQGPGTTDTSSFQVLDDLITRFSDQSQFPSLTSIFVTGHSLGGSVTQRYAMLRNNDSSTDSLVNFWIGNPGSYVWPSSQRPIMPSNTTCSSTFDEWAYGVSDGLPAYVKGHPDPSTIYTRYRTRSIQYALGLDDNGPGDTHCEAQYQGTSHLTRGENMQKALEQMQGGMPSTQSFNYVPNTSHQDYLMMSDPNSQEYLFVTGLANSRPKGSQTKSSSGSGSSGSGSKSGSLGKASSGSSNFNSEPFTILQNVFFGFISFTIFTSWI